MSFTVECASFTIKCVSLTVECVSYDCVRVIFREKVAFCEEKKAEGNALFKLQKLPRALQKYKKALSAVESDHDFDDGQKEMAAVS